MLYDIIPELKQTEKGQLQAKKLPHLKNIIYLGHDEYPGMFTWKDILEKSDLISDDELNERMTSLHVET